MVLVLAAATACSDERGSAVVVSRGPDGEEIVLSNAPSLGVHAWKVDSVPFLVLGAPGAIDTTGGNERERAVGTEAAGDSAYQFSMILGARRMSDGRYVVLEGSPPSVRIFDSTGRFLRSFGRRGEGPGEFSGLTSLLVTPDGRILVGGSRGTMIFTAAGEYIETLREPGTFGNVVGVFDDGGFVTGKAGFSVIPEQGPAHDTMTASYGFVSGDGTRRDSIIGLQSIVFRRVPAMKTLTFGPRGYPATHDSTFYWGFSGDYSIRAYDPRGKLRRVVRRAWTPREVTAADREGYGTSLRTPRSELFRDPVFAERHPAFSGLLVDEAGYLWVREYRPADGYLGGAGDRPEAGQPEWSVFDPAGRWVTSVVMHVETVDAPGLRDIAQIGEDYILARGSSPAGALQLKVFRLSR